MSYGQSAIQSYSQEKPSYLPVRAQEIAPISSGQGSRVFSSGQSYSSPLVSSNSGQGSYPANSYQESNEQSTVYNGQDQSALSKSQSNYGSNDQSYNSYTGPSYQLATQSVNQSPYRATFYPVASTSGQGAKQSNHDAINDYYADPDCLPGSEYGSTAQTSAQSPQSTSYNSPKATIPALPVTGSSRPTSYTSVITDQSKYSTNIVHSAVSGSSPSVSSSAKSPSSSVQGFESEELDPSKLDLKIVHLPVSLLKKLVSSGDVTLGGQSLYAKA